MNGELKNKDNILDSLAEAVFTVDKEFKVTFFNNVAEKLMGLKREEVLGEFCKTVFQSELCSISCPIANVLQSGKSVFDMESKIQCKSGIVPIKLNSAVLKNDDNEPIGGVISFRDMTYSNKIKQQLESTTQFFGLIGKSKKMKDIFNLITEISESNASVFIRGETGTGKELIAEAIVKTSQRKNKKFVKVNCSVLPPTLLASELFGHTKGAFTDAIKDRIGRFEYADGGTIFLDEISEIFYEMQSQLLRILQEGSFERLGESISRKVNVRVIAASNKKVEELIQQVKFREDLFYRLNVIPIEIPPLRERKEDIPLLIKYFIYEFTTIYNKDVNDIDDNALDFLLRWNYPGNIRELKNIIEFAIVRIKERKSICACNLPQYLRDKVDCDDNREDAINDLNTSQLIFLLEKHHWNKTKVAEELRVNRSTIWRRMKATGLA